MATEIWVNIGSGNGLLPDGTKPLPEPMLIDHQCSPVTFILGQFHEMPQSSITEVSLKITYLKFHSNLPGANELNPHSFPNFKGYHLNHVWEFGMDKSWKSLLWETFVGTIACRWHVWVEACQTVQCNISLDRVHIDKRFWILHMSDVTHAFLA